MTWVLTVIGGVVIAVAGAAAKHYFDSRKPFEPKPPKKTVVRKTAQQWRDEAIEKDRQ